MEETKQVVKVKANQHESYWSFSAIAALLPLIGLILGVAFLTKDKKLDRKLGEHLIALSVLFMIVWGLGGVLFLLHASSSQTVVPTYSY